MKKLLRFLSIASLATSAVAISCSNAQKQRESKILFATSQGDYFPLIMGLKEIIPLYNQQMKDQPNFLPVQLLTSNDTKTNSELKLAAQNAEYIKNDDSKLANIFLGNQAGAFLINSYNKLLDVSSVLPVSYFPSKLVTTHTNLAGEKINNTRIYNLPFDVTDIDGFSINIDLLNKAFEFLKQAGATIDENSKIYQYALQHKDLGNQIPSNSLINYLKIKDDTNLKGYIINDATFNGIESLFDLARKLKSILEFDKSKVETSDQIDDLAIFTIDERDDAFLKVLNNKLQGKRIWQLQKTNDKYDFSKVKYNLEDASIKKAFIDTFNEFVALNHNEYLNNAVFQDIKFENQMDEWGSWALRDYKAIFSFVANVGYEQSMDSPISRFFYLSKDDKEKYKKWAQKDDIYLQEQLTKNRANDAFSTYIEGGSNLIPISIDNGGKQDNATLLFLKWLYQGNVNYNGEYIKVTDLLAQKTGYIIPQKSQIESASDWYVQRQTILTNKIKLLKNQLKTNSNNSDEIQKQIDKLSTESNYLYAADTTFKGLKNFENSKSEDIFWVPIDQTTSAIVEKIRSLLLDSTLKKNPKIITGEQAYQIILNMIKNS
ncbi:P68 family surface lipoprotein [Mycoplasma sp. AC1221]